MRGRFFLFLLSFALVGALLGQSRLLSAQAIGLEEPGGYTLGFVVNGLERRINVYVPAGYEPSGEAMPLLLALHGAGGTGASLSTITGFNELATEQGFIVAYPDGYNGGWNDARLDLRTLEVDDIRFLNGMIDFLVSELNIDTDRVYAAGYSMGGMMSFRLGCQLRDKIAAVASVASTFPAYQLDACLFADPVPVLVIQGTEDQVVPAEGGRDRFGNRVMLSVDETMRYWSETNGYASGVRIQFLPDTAPDDGTRVRRETYDDCAQGVGTELLLVSGGGHSWPGHPFSASVNIGPTSMDIDASAEIWRFFEAHTLSGGAQ